MPILVNIIMSQDGYIVIRAMITNVYVDEQPMMVQNDSVFHCICLFPPIKPCAMCFILRGLANFNQSAIHLDNFHKYAPKLSLSLGMGHQISSSSASFMHDAMNITSSHNAYFGQFHINATYIVTLSCFM